GAQPHETAFARVAVGRVGAVVARADAPVQAVGGADDIGLVLFGDALVVGVVRFEHQVDEQFYAADLHDNTDFVAGGADEAVAAAADAATLVMNGDVVPVVEGLADLLGRHRIGFLQVFQGGIGKNHAPAKSVVRTIPLDDGDFVRGVAKFHQQTEIQASGATA